MFSYLNYHVPVLTDIISHLLNINLSVKIDYQLNWESFTHLKNINFILYYNKFSKSLIKIRNKYKKILFNMSFLL